MASVVPFIAVDPKSFHQKRPRGTVIGTLFVRFEGGVFPEEGWSDLPVAVLKNWIDAWINLVEVPSRREVQWEFMDGPHSLTVTRVDRTASSGAIEFQTVHQALLEAAESVLAYCDEQKLDSRELEILREATQRLRMVRGDARLGAGRIAYFEARTRIPVVPRRARPTAAGKS
jgi:hypothetical protein